MTDFFDIEPGQKHREKKIVLFRKKSHIKIRSIKKVEFFITSWLHIYLHLSCLWYKHICSLPAGTMKHFLSRRFLRDERGGLILLPGNWLFLASFRREATRTVQHLPWQLSPGPQKLAFQRTIPTVSQRVPGALCQWLFHHPVGHGTPSPIKSGLHSWQKEILLHICFWLGARS